MKLENQVVSLELSKQLKEAGYKQEGLFQWYKGGFSKIIYDYDTSAYNASLKLICVAPTVAELGEALLLNEHYFISGREIFNTKQDYFCRMAKYIYAGIQTEKTIHWERAKTEADARAQMWLYLKKEELL